MILDTAKECKELWIKEIEIMKPDLIVCGGTYNFIKGPLRLTDIQLGTGGRFAKLFDRNCIIIDMNHPAYRISPVLFYAFFKDCILEIRNKHQLLTLR